jgi:hypothetical protein
MHSFRRATLNLLRLLENTSLPCFTPVILPCWHAKMRYIVQCDVIISV